MHHRPPRAVNREVQLTGAFNVRDLGGIPATGDRITVPGLVYRSDSLDSLTDGDKRRLFGELRISAILDLRTPEEAGGDGLSDARLLEGLTVYSFPVIPDGRIGVEPFPAGDAEAVAKIYLEYVVDRAEIVGGAVNAVAASVSRGVPALFHCAAGRDRTGVVAAMLLSLLDVDDDEIVADYVGSNRQAEQVSQRLTLNPLYRNDEADPARGSHLVDPVAMRRFLELYRAEFDNHDHWARYAGIGSDTLANLRATLLAPLGPITTTQS
jgi:hypothetical protein